MLIDIKEILKVAEDNGFTDATIRKLSGINRSNLWRYRHEGVQPQAKTLAKLLKALNPPERTSNEQRP